MEIMFWDPTKIITPGNECKVRILEVFNEATIKETKVRTYGMCVCGCACVCEWVGVSGYVCHSESICVDTSNVLYMVRYLSDTMVS